MNYKLLLSLSIRYIKAHKKLFFPFLTIIFLSTFLISTVFIIKDSYDDYALRLAQKQSGAWDVSYAYQGIQYLNENEKQFIEKHLSSVMYEQHLPYYYQKNKQESFLAVTNFTVLPITLLDGTYPNNSNEILIEQSFRENTNYTIGKQLILYDENETKYTFTITGIIKEVLDSPTTLFYTYLDDTTQAFTVYANMKEESMQNFPSDTLTFRLNEEVINKKYHVNKDFTYTYLIFISFLCLCAFIFLYNASSLYLYKKQQYLTQLHTLGATKKQVLLCVCFEYFLLCGILFCVSLCISLCIWYVLFNVFGNIFAQYLHLSIPFHYVLENKHLIVLCTIIFIIFIFSFLLTLKKTYKPKQSKLYFRNIKFHRVPLQLRIALLDTIRTGYSIYMILTLVLCSTLFLTTQYIVENWLQEQKTLVENAYDVSASFHLFSHDAHKINETVHQIEQLCTTYQANTCLIQYSIQHEIYIGDNMVKGYTLDTTTYQNLLKKHHLSPQDSILVHKNSSNQVYDEMQIHILDTWQSQVDIVSIPYTQIYDETIPITTTDDMFVIFPTSLTDQWITMYPSTSISGQIQIQSIQSDAIASALSTMSSLDDDDLIYVQNHVENMKQFKKDQGAVRIFIYSFHITIMLVTLFVLYNLLTQYMAQIKHELFLLTILGMSKRTIQKQFIQRTLIFTVISILFFVCIVCSLLLIFHAISTTLLNISSLITSIFLYCIVLVCIMIILTLYVLRHTMKSYPQ